MVGEALGRDPCADPFDDETAHLDDPVAPVQVRLDAIADRDRRGRLAGLAVHLDVAAADGLRGVGSRLRETDGVKPLVETDGFDVASVVIRIERSPGALEQHPRGDRIILVWSG